MAAPGLHNLLTDGEAYSRPGVVGAGLDQAEHPKEPLLVVFRNTRPSVFNPDPELALVVAELDKDPSFVSVLEAVVDYVDKDLEKPVLIDLDSMNCRVEVLDNLEVQVPSLCLFSVHPVDVRHNI